MKAYNIFFLILIIVTSCKKSGIKRPDINSDIVKRWYYTEQVFEKLENGVRVSVDTAKFTAKYINVQFNKDGSGVYNEGPGTPPYSFSYTIIGTMLKIDFAAVNFNQISNPATIIELTPTKLKFTYSYYSEQYNGDNTRLVFTNTCAVY